MDEGAQVPRSVIVRRRASALALVATLAGSLIISTPAAAAVQQDDAGTKRDAGNSFDTATPVRPSGRYDGELNAAAGDTDDYYRFSLKEGSALSVLVEFTSGALSEPVTLLDPSGSPVDIGTRTGNLGITLSSVMTSEFPAVRLAVHRALVGGDYRLHLRGSQFPIRGYSLCFMNCESVVSAPTDLIFGGSLPTTGAKVLLIPPSHGDLGNPLGPTVLDYIDATLRGIRKWNDAIARFTKDFPEYAYLRKIAIHIDVFDGVKPVDPALYDVILGYAAAGPAFRGVAVYSDPADLQGTLEQLGLTNTVRFTGRLIILSLFGSAPRAGQVLYDFPELSDLEIVTTHEFGHTFGLGHTRTWHPRYGPDLMNSPAPFVYGDGFPLGDGGERTKRKCLSTINLYGMAVLYRWIPSGKWVPSEGQARLPRGMPYTWYC